MPPSLSPSMSLQRRGLVAARDPREVLPNTARSIPSCSTSRPSIDEGACARLQEQDTAQAEVTHCTQGRGWEHGSIAVGLEDSTQVVIQAHASPQRRHVRHCACTARTAAAVDAVSPCAGRQFSRANYETWEIYRKTLTFVILAAELLWCVHAAFFAGDCGDARGLARIGCLFKGKLECCDTTPARWRRSSAVVCACAGTDTRVVSAPCRRSLA